MEIEMGSVYKLDHHTKLPKSTANPASLNSIKAVMVKNKSDDEVTVVFPSMKSVRNFFENKKVSGLMQPNLDEHFVMNLNVAKKLLSTKVPFEEFAAQRSNRSFWIVDHHHHDTDHDHDHEDGDDDDDDDEEDDRQVSSNGGLEIRWRKRRRTTFYGKQRVPSFDDRRKKMSIVPYVDEEEGEEEDEQKEEKTIPEKTRILRKRKCHLKGVKYCETKKNNNKKKMIKRVSEKKFKDSQHRWTVERYKLAEKNMLKILKEKEAGPGNPILRPDLRTEARKLIGDTGLLDHLLKHMAGKIAPGGKERFRRRHNPEGAMEYWIESADLIETRKQAGVTDPYWVPPPGWKPGDCPNQDPVCGSQLKEVKGEVADMKRELEKLASRGKENNQASIESLKGLHNELMKKKADIERQLLEISKTFSGMEEDIEWLKETVAEETKGDHQRELVLGIMAEENNNQKTAAIINEPDHDDDQISEEKEMMIMLQPQKPLSATIAERRQKLKSGFRICKPQGTFLWPSQIASSAAVSPNNQQQVVVHLEDLLGYPTPPSVSSSSCSKPRPILPSPPYHHHHQQQLQLPPSPRVKRPVATRAAVTLNFSIATIRGSTTIDSISSPTSTAATGFSSVHSSFVPDLNEVPLTSLA